MVNVTINVSDELKKTLEKFPEINWSEVARQAWAAKASQLELLNKITSKSKVSDRDLSALSKLIKQGVSKRHSG